MMKKISAIILALVLCLSVMVVPVSAAVELGDAQIAIALEWDKEYYNPGDTAVLSIYVDAADDLSLYTGNITIGFNSAVINMADNPIATVKANSTTNSTFASYYKEAKDTTAWFTAATLLNKLIAANTAEENEKFDTYLKFGLAKNTSGGWHENTGVNNAGFNGSEFDPTEPIATFALKISDSAPNGTPVEAKVTTGSYSVTPVAQSQTAWKYYKNPGAATTTGDIAASGFSSTAATPATIGEPAAECTHANVTTSEEVTANATCTAAGSKTVTTTCADCSEVVSTETVAIPATGHSYSTVVTAPTCTTEGYTTYTCACGDTKVDDKVAALGHSYNAVVTAPTCTAAGYTTYTCSVCNDTYVADEVAATGHTYTSAETTAPTCTEAGVMTYTCACGDTYTEAIAAKGHALTSVEAKAPTCTEAGYEAYEFCSVCDYTTYAEVAATGHNYDAVVTAPTCTAEGYTTYTCACGDSYVADYTAVADHTYDVVVEDATFTEAGKATYTCTACGDTYTEVIPVKTLLAPMKGQIRFKKNADGSYAGKFDIRAIAKIDKADFEATFGSEAGAKEMIQEIGFVFAKGSVVTNPSLDDAKAIVENGETVSGYAKKPISTITKGISGADYAFTCLVTGMTDAAKTDSLVAIAYVVFTDADGNTTYAYYPEVQIVEFEGLFNTYFGQAFPG